MDDQRYAEESCYSMSSQPCRVEPQNAALESSGPWLFASQIREMLGEDGDLDPNFLEESWVSGVPAGMGTFRAEREQAAGANVGGVTFAELGSVGNIFYGQAHAMSGDSVASSHSAHAKDSYTAAWLQDPMPSWTPQRAPASKFGEDAKEPPTMKALRSMTHQRACELLCVSRDSSGAEIKAAYRRMVVEWHPDRMEQSGERVRALATKQMVAINDAYHFLRNSSPVAST